MMWTGATTGTCAAAAAKAAALYAHRLPVPRNLDVPLPQGQRASVKLRSWGGLHSHPWASVRKPRTEDPDATREAVVVVSLETAEDLRFIAGAGVGIVTRPGLQVPVGEPAINPGPREQIANALSEVGTAAWAVTISVLGGKDIAQRTFNPRLGIMGGISILGSNGIVRPWSTEAFLNAIDAHLSVLHAQGQQTVILVPGHMGEKAASRIFPGLECVEVGNAWGEVLDRIRRYNFHEVVALGHPGKLTKLAQGQWDTHSSQGSSAADWSIRFLLNALPGLNGILPGGNQSFKTMEGLLLALDPTSREMASSLLASRVARSITTRCGVNARTIFVDLKGNIMGEGAS